jgi:hypothetical protein
MSTCLATSPIESRDEFNCVLRVGILDGMAEQWQLWEADIKSVTRHVNVPSDHRAPITRVEIMLTGTFIYTSLIAASSLMSADLPPQFRSWAALRAFTACSVPALSRQELTCIISHLPTIHDGITLSSW